MTHTTCVHHYTCQHSLSSWMQRLNPLRFIHRKTKISCTKRFGSKTATSFTHAPIPVYRTVPLIPWKRNLQGTFGISFLVHICVCSPHMADPGQCPAGSSVTVKFISCRRDQEEGEEIYREREKEVRKGKSLSFQTYWCIQCWFQFNWYRFFHWQCFLCGRATFRQKIEEGRRLPKTEWGRGTPCNEAATPESLRSSGEKCSWKKYREVKFCPASSTQLTACAAHPTVLGNPTPSYGLQRKPAVQASGFGGKEHEVCPCTVSVLDFTFVAVREKEDPPSFAVSRNIVVHYHTWVFHDASAEYAHCLGQRYMNIMLEISCI